MNDKITEVGFIGLGRMGKPMAINILNAGFALTVFDSREEPIRELASLGARAAKSAREVAETSRLIAIAVVDDGQVEEVFGGALAASCDGTILAIHSTVYPETVTRLAKLAKAKNVRVIDAPISGGEAGARDKSLCYMIGGDLAILELCREVFSTSAAEIFHLGALGNGAAAKMIVQVVTCINMLGAHEAQTLAERSGLDFANLQKVLHVSSGQSFVTDNWLHRFKLPQDPIEIRRGRTEVFQKSLAPAIEVARQMGLSLPGADLVERLLPQIMGIKDS